MSEHNSTRAVVYHRVARDTPETPDGQLEAVREYAEACGYEIVPPYVEEDATPSPAPIPPLETERQARELPAVRAIYAAFEADPGQGKMAPLNLAMLADACVDAGIGDDLGAYDVRILEWLAGWEPATCAVVAGLITRAAEGRQS